jgi:glycosyltransferase involved in cell wall biosynthesis
MQILAWPGRLRRGHNAYTKLLYDAIDADGKSDTEIVEYSFRTAVRSRPDVFHMHWPEWAIVQSNPLKAYGRLAALIFVLVRFRLVGTKIVWTVHNLHPHLRFSRLREGVLYWSLGRLVNLQIHLTKATAEEMTDVHHLSRGTRSRVVPHGPLTQRDDYPDRRHARQRLGFSSEHRLIAFVGGIDWYKGVDKLIEEFRHIPGDDLRLIVAGKPHGAEIAGVLRDAAARDTRVVLDLRFVPEDELLSIVAAADFLVLPYVEGLNSGTIFLALAGSRPVIVPATATFRSLQAEFGENWIRLYSEEELSSTVLERLLSVPAPTGQAPSIPSWERIASETLESYREALKSRRPKAKRLSDASS